MVDSSGSITSRSRWLGCLLGGAVGDALGNPIEFLSLAEIRSRFGPDGLRTYALVGDRRGVISDDTQMTLFTAEGLIRASNRWTNRGLVNETSVVWRAYQRWLETQEHAFGERSSASDRDAGWLVNQPALFDVQSPGMTCLSALRSGEPGTIVARHYPQWSPSYDLRVVDEDTGQETEMRWSERDHAPEPTTTLNDSKGCGGVMRVAPVGLVARDPFLLGAQIAALTHGHTTGYLAAGAFCRIISELRSGRPLGEATQSAVAELRNWPEHAETALALETALRHAKTADASPESIGQLGAGWVAEEALAIAVFSALKAQSFLDGVSLAANHGGDSDSTAAITGNLLGTILGVEAIPAQLVNALETTDLVRRVAEDLANCFLDHHQPYDLDRYPPN